MGKRFLFGKNDNQLLQANVYMKSDYLGWDEVKYVDGRKNLDDIIEDAREKIEVYYEPEEDSVYISSEKGCESFWNDYRNLINNYFRSLHHPIPSYNRKRKVITKKYFQKGDMAIIDNWFIEIHIKFLVTCKVEHVSLEAPNFCYKFKSI